MHAISTACHVDLHKENGVFYPVTVKICLNNFFRTEDIPIRILQSYLVPDTFHSRHSAISRTYLYRLLVKKTKELISVAKSSDYIPIEEWGRCHFLW